MQYEDYRQILKNELTRRCGNNALYSLRAFARDIGVSPSQLTEVLGGKHGLSGRKAKTVSQNLGFNKEETNFFVDLVEATHGRSEVKRELAKIRIQNKQQHSKRAKEIDLDTFAVISNWYYFAILEMTFLPYFQSDINWIATNLQLNSHEVKEAIERLLRMELLEKVDGRYCATNKKLITPTEIPSLAIKNYHSQILDKAKEAIELQSISDRDFGAINFRLDSSDMDFAKEEIKKFRRDLTQKLEERSQGKDTERLYCLTTQLFNLTQIRVQQGEQNEMDH